MDKTFRIIRWSDHAYFFCCSDHVSFFCSNLNASQIHDVSLSQIWYLSILNLDVFICRYLLKKILHRFPRWGWSDWCCWSILQRMLLSDWNHSVYDSFMCFECWLLWIEYQNEHSAGWWIVIILREWLVRVPRQPFVHSIWSASPSFPHLWQHHRLLHSRVFHPFWKWKTVSVPVFACSVY